MLAIFFSVLSISVVQLYVAAPLGLALDLDRHSVALASFIGGMVGVVVMVFFGPALINSVTSFFRWLFRRPAKEPSEDAGDEPPGRFSRLVDRFGAPFLGVVGPLTIGGWAAAVLGVSNGIGKVKLIAWLAVGQAIVTATYVYSIAELSS